MLFTWGRITKHVCLVIIIMIIICIIITIIIIIISILQKSVNALLAVRRMSLSPLFAAKRRSSMDPSILKSASENEEDHVVDRKVSEPIDPVGLSIPNRRHGETRSSCFDLDINTIKALREKADKALGGVLIEKADNDGDITCQKDSEDESSHSSEDCSDEVDKEELQTKNCDNSASCSYQKQRANTFCGQRAARKEASKGERKTSAISSVGNDPKKDFKPVSSTFNAEDLHKNNKLVCESTTVHNTLVNEPNARDYRMEKDFALSQELCQFSPERGENCTFEPNNSKSLLDESIQDTSGTDHTGEELPQICINDHLMVTSSPPPISVTLNNNIENTDKNSIAIGSTQSLQISPSLNIITSGNKLTGDGAKSISVKLGNLNGVQITCDHVTPSVRRASTGSASC